MADPKIPPVHDTSATPPEPGIALCLSGGGYRAMLFHVGCLWRLNQLGMLARLDRISSVSGGSITSGVLGMNWRELGLAPGEIGRASCRERVGRAGGAGRGGREEWEEGRG